jgi:LacI family transcriptional regulator
VGALSYLNDNKIKIPEQMAVIGFSNWFMSQVITPKLSTIDQPRNGEKSFHLLLEEMNCHKEGVAFTPRTIELDTSVIIRESSLKIK